ncbi:unnamed protein product [Pleuronectes platessa]|uniref:Uncharacterized protein n=1 Tax=Pleuronectes platessa TaxID=8262 RepID=A0A9N7Y9S2_PLEPL|nr:unnamed protein product [Pleuronectes platessa]
MRVGARFPPVESHGSLQRHDSASVSVERKFRTIEGGVTELLLNWYNIGGHGRSIKSGKVDWSSSTGGRQRLSARLGSLAMCGVTNRQSSGVSIQGQKTEKYHFLSSTGFLHVTEAKVETQHGRLKCGEGEPAARRGQEVRMETQGEMTE